tara:strand:- start:30 stop:209 length:180 start_codon:yes stop_codon:yes gene_type:complete
MDDLKGINSFGFLIHDKTPVPNFTSFQFLTSKSILTMEAVGNFTQLEPVISDRKFEKIG